MSSVVPYTTGIPPAVAGDTGDYRILKCSGVDSLTNATSISADVWLDGEPKTTLAGVVESATKKTVRIELGGVGGWLATAEPGEYNLEVNIAFGAGTGLTWPARQPAILGVRAPG